MIYCINESRKLNLLVDMTPSIISFAERLSLDEYEPTIDILVSVLGIIGDLCSMYRDRMRSLVNQNRIRSIMIILAKHDPQRFSDIIEWANNVNYE
jgi:hypothetical protein